MTTFNADASTGAGTPSDMTAWDLSKFARAEVLISDDDRFTIQLEHNIIWDFFGTDLEFDSEGFPVSGTLTGFMIYDNNDTFGTVSGISMDIAVFNAFMAAKDTAGFQHALFTGDDTIFGAYHAVGYEGNDTLTGGVVFDGGAGDDTITVVGGLSPAVVDAGDGSDSVVFQGGILSSQVNGGAGVDLLSINGGFPPVTLAFATFDETVLTSLGFEKLRVNGSAVGDATGNAFDFSAMPLKPATGHQLGLDGAGGNDTIVGLVGFTNLLHGGEGDDTLTGGDANDTLWGDAGTDVVYGFGGNDTINAASFMPGDSLYAGSGDDTVIVNSNTTIGNSDWFGGEGTDWLRLILDSVTIDRPDFTPVDLGFEEIEFSGSPLYGGAGDNVLDFSGLTYRGGSLSELELNGQAGDDTLVGISGAAANTLSGSIGNDLIIGGDVVDFIDGGVGNDAIVGGKGDDHIVDGDGQNRIKSGAGNDSVQISAGETLAKGGGGNDQLGSVSDGEARFYGGSGDDGLSSRGGGRLVGGNGNDHIAVSSGADLVFGGKGDDAFNIDVFEDSFSAADSIDAGAGIDVLNLFVDIVFTDTMLVNVEEIFASGVEITMANGNVAAGATLEVTANSAFGLPGLTFEGFLETDGNFIVHGTLQDDTIIGGAQADVLYGSNGADFLGGDGGADYLNGGADADLFAYIAVTDSTGPGFDTIDGFNAAEDAFGFTFEVTGTDPEVTSGALNSATFDSDMAAAIGAAQLAAHHGVFFTPDSGNLAGQLFVIVDQNGTAGYQAGQDFVIELVNAINLRTARAELNDVFLVT